MRLGPETWGFEGLLRTSEKIKLLLLMFAFGKGKNTAKLASIPVSEFPCGGGEEVDNLFLFLFPQPVKKTEQKTINLGTRIQYLKNHSAKSARVSII